MTGRSTPYLTQRGVAFYFRMSVPKSLRKSVGLVELVGSLRTSDRGTAAALCHRLASAMTVTWRMARMNPEAPELKGIVRAQFHRMLRKMSDVAHSLGADEGTDLDFERSDTERHLSKLRCDLIAQVFDKTTLGYADEAMEKAGVHLKVMHTRDLSDPGPWFHLQPKWHFAKGLPWLREREPGVSVAAAVSRSRAPRAVVGWHRVERRTDGRSLSEFAAFLSYVSQVCCFRPSGSPVR